MMTGKETFPETSNIKYEHDCSTEISSSRLFAVENSELLWFPALCHMFRCNYLPGICLTGQEVEVKRLSIRGLLPDTDYYMTYDGSTTMPACHETVTWVILNKPIYITKQQVLHTLVQLSVAPEA